MESAGEPAMHDYGKREGKRDCLTIGHAKRNEKSGRVGRRDANPDALPSGPLTF
jgi:hypothetical protein